jgi:hypothetical protein
VLVLVMAPDRWPQLAAWGLFVLFGLSYLRWGLQDLGRAGHIGRTIKFVGERELAGASSWSTWMIVLLAIGLGGNFVGLVAIILRIASR